VVKQILDLERPRYSIEWDDGHQSIMSPASGALHVARPSGLPVDFSSMLFRAVNEHISELGWAWFDEHDFICECPEASCFERMRMGSKEFEALKSDPSVFAIVPGHEHPAEQILLRTDRYVLVRHGGADTSEGV
jgi:hypothetical protein